MNLTIQEDKRWGSKLCTNLMLQEMLLLLIVPICFSEKVDQPALHHLLLILLDWTICSFIMGTKIIYKGFKYISQIFVVKEQEMEMEIGHPTDVKHVAHIGWDGPSSSAPSWMNEFKTVPNFAATSIASRNERGSNSAVSTWSSQEFESMDSEPATETLKDGGETPADLPRAPRKQKRRKKKTSSSSPKSAASRASRGVKSKANYVEGSARPPNVEVM